MFENNNRKILLEQLLHIFNLSTSEEPIVFELNITDIISESALELKYFRRDPSKYLEDLINGIKSKLIEITIPKDKEPDCREVVDLYRKLENTQLQVKCIPYTKLIYHTFGEVNSDHINQWIVITGTVIQSTPKKTLDKSKMFQCLECGALYRVRTTYENGHRFEMPVSCLKMVQKEKNKSFIAQLYTNFNRRKSKGKSENEQKEIPELKLMKCGSTKFSPIEQNKICIDYQELRIQEQFQFISSGKIPQTAIVIIEGNLCGNNVFRPGDDLTITGKLSYRYKKLIKEFKILPQMVIVANSIVIEKNGNYISEKETYILDNKSETQMSKIYANFPLNYYSEYELTSKERIIIKQLEFRKEIIESFCPSIYGRDMIKLGLLLSLLGGVSLDNESSKIRGHSHVLLVGEPGTGKSVLLKEIAKISDRSFFTNGIGTTSAGLSVSYFKEGGDWMIEAGALVLADNGVCCIDELTLLSKKDEKSLLESMEQQTISSAKASVVGKLNARTTVICACNPIRPGQKYDDEVDLETNTGLSVPLLTRFDMIFIMKDERDIAEDAEKCDHILEKVLILLMEFCEEKNVGKNNRNKFQYQEKLNLKALIKKCKTFSPHMSNHELLTIYYTEERKKENKVKTARAFESLCRIAEAHAKLMLRESTILLDYVTAISLTENTFFSTIEEYYAILDNFNEKFNLDLS